MATTARPLSPAKPGASLEIGFELLTTPVQRPQCNGMAEAFVLTIKRDHARVNPMPTPEIVMHQLPKRFDYYNELHPPRRWQTVLRECPSQTAKPRRRIRSLRGNYSDAERGSLVRSLVPPSAPISAGEDDVLVDEDVELVSWANLQCRLYVEILVDRAFGDAAERLREISPCGVGRRVLGGER